MTAGDHATPGDEVGAYLLGALSDAEPEPPSRGTWWIARSAGTGRAPASRG